VRRPEMKKPPALDLAKEAEFLKQRLT